MTRVPSRWTRVSYLHKRRRSSPMEPLESERTIYVALDGKLMSMTLEFSANGATVRALNPVALFQTRIGTGVQGAQKQQYLVSKDASDS